MSIYINYISIPVLFKIAASLLIYQIISVRRDLSCHNWNQGGKKTNKNPPCCLPVPEILIGLWEVMSKTESLTLLVFMTYNALFSL